MRPGIHVGVGMPLRAELPDQQQEQRHDDAMQPGSVQGRYQGLHLSGLPVISHGAATREFVGNFVIIIGKPDYGNCVTCYGV